MNNFVLTLESYHLVSLLLALLLTFCFYFSYWGLSKKGNFLESLCLYPLFLCTLSIVLPFSAVATIVVVLALAGVIVGFFKIDRLKIKKTSHFCLDYYRSSTKVEKITIWFCCIHVASGIIGATVLGGEGAIVDAMTYHLGAPKEWSLFLNGPHLSKINPESLTGSYYEYLLYPLFIILKPLYEHLAPLPHTGHEFLSYTLLLTGQLILSFISMVLIPYVLLKLFKNKMLFFYLILTLILGMKGMNWVWKTAKNDAYPLFCALVSYSYFIKNYRLDKNKIKKNIFISFIILGVGLGSKMTNLYPMVLILLYIFIKNYKSIKSEFVASKISGLVAVSMGAGIIALLPFLLRNFIETSNPFYPTSSNFFKNIYLTDSTEAFHKLYSHPTSWIIALDKVLRLLTFSPGFLLLIGLSLYFRKWKEVLFFLFSILVIAKVTGERFTWRQVSMLLFFVVLWGEYLFNFWLSNKKSFHRYFPFVVVILLLSVSQFKPERLFKYPFRNYFEVIEDVMPRNYSSWSLQLEENLNKREDRKFKSTYSSYFSRFRHINMTDSREEYRGN